MSKQTFPQTRSPHEGGFDAVPSPKKKIGADWGASNEAMNPRNDPQKRYQYTGYNEDSAYCTYEIDDTDVDHPKTGGSMENDEDND